MSGRRSFEEYETEIQAVSERHPIDTAYQHFKGNTYKVVGYGVWELTDEIAVEYISIEHPVVKLIRAVSVWEEVVEIEGRSVPRFSRIG